MKYKLLTTFNIFLTVVLLASIMLFRIKNAFTLYDPWLDNNDDGKIDLVDLFQGILHYGEEGEPVAKAALMYESGWINITDMCGQYIEVVHNLNTTDIIVDITGKVRNDSEPHQRHLGLTSYNQGWSQTYGGTGNEYAHSLVQTSDRGYALAGETESFGSGVQCYLVKTDAAGNMQWNKTYGGANTDRAYSLVQTSDGGYAMGGLTSSFGSMSQCYLVKTNSTGNMQWNKTYGGANRDETLSLIQTQDGGYALAGWTESFGSGYQCYLVKTDSAGNMQWNKTYGGANDELGWSLVQTSDGGYAIAGLTDVFGPSSKCYLVKTDAAGNMQWNQTYGGANRDAASSLVQTSDGGYAMGGFTNSFGSGYQCYLAKIDSAGNMQWNKTYGGVYDDFTGLIVQTADGGYAIGGYADFFGAGYSDAWLVKTDAAGNMQWNQTYGGANDERILSMVHTLDGRYALAGMTESYGSGRQFYLVKTDSELGLCRSGSTDDSVWLYRGATDPYWNYVQVRIWKIRETP